MKQNYEFCIKEVLKSEGGYSDDLHDNGGPTNFGITIHDYRAYINANGTPNDVRNMSVEQAEAIYKTKYWDKVNGDELPSGVDYCVFDYGVNSGVSRANRVYHQYASTSNPIDKICNERMAFLRRLPTWPYFGRGWTSRVAHVRTLSQRMAANVLARPVPQPPVPEVTPTWYTTLIKNLLPLLQRFWKIFSSRSTSAV